jgi:drug/metabolite transporter (DMT)-like permease
MAGWLALMLIMTIAGRETTRELSVFQIMEVRSILGFFMLYPLIRLHGGLAAMKTSRPLQHVGRNLIHYAAQLGWFFALTLIPLGQVVSIEFTMPIWTAILAASFLGERITAGKIAAIELGVVGVLIIVRPAAGEINPGQLIALGAAIGFGISIAMMKSLTRTENTLTIIFWMLVIQSAAGFFPALYVWIWPSAYAFGWIVVIAFCGTFCHYWMARAMLYCRRDRGAADGLPAGSADGHRGLADLFGAAGHVHGARRGADPCRQSLESEISQSGACAHRHLIGPRSPARGRES